MQRRADRSFRILAVAFGLFLVLGMGAVGEWVARTWGDVEKPPTLFADPSLRLRDRPFVVPDEQFGFRLKPGFSQTGLNIDDQGFRITPTIFRPPKETVLTLGDSTTFGWSVSDLESYPSQLAFLLHKARPDYPVRVINGGVPSYTSAQVERYLRDLLSRMKPDVVVLSVLWNDVWFSMVQNWFPELLVFARPSPWREYLNENSALFRWTVQARRFAAPARDVPNDQARQAYVANVVRAAQLSIRSGARTYFLIPPFDESRVGPRGVDPFRQNTLSKQALVERARNWTLDVTTALESEGAIVIDHEISVRRSARDDLFIDLIHPNQTGNQLIAATVQLALDEPPPPAP